MAKQKTKKEWQPPSKEEGNKFDKIFKENMRELAPPLLEALAGLKDYWLEPLPEVKLQVTRQKDPDFLQILHDARTPQGRLLHVEFEGQDTADVDWTMLEYCGMAGMIYRKEIEQHLVYYGNGEPKNIRGEIPHTIYTFKYRVHLISKVGAGFLLHQQKPEAVIFAILANPEGYTSDEIIELILQRLIALKGDLLAIRKFLHQLLMLSRKRNLQAKIYQAMEKMDDFEAYELDYFYMKGEKKAWKKA